MTGQWEKYAEQAAEPLDPAAFDRTDPQHDHWAMDFRRGIAKDRALRMLATVGPLIAEDTRDRMVAAAAAALEREGYHPDLRAEWVVRRQGFDRWLIEFEGCEEECDQFLASAHDALPPNVHHLIHKASRRISDWEVTP